MCSTKTGERCRLQTKQGLLKPHYSEAMASRAKLGVNRDGASNLCSKSRRCTEMRELNR